MSVADFAGGPQDAYVAELDAQALRKSVRPIGSPEELRADVWESDRELDDFLADLEAFRHAHMA